MSPKYLLIFELDILFVIMNSLGISEHPFFFLNLKNGSIMNLWLLEGKDGGKE